MVSFIFTNSSRVALCLLLAVGLLVLPGCGNTPVPVVVGMEESATEAAIIAAGLTVGTVTEEFSATVPAGQVISQNPSAATLVNAGATVNLVISKGPQPGNVPNVVGQTQVAAAVSLTAVGLKVGTVTKEFSDTAPTGQVIGQNPGAGAQATPGTAIDLTVSKGPQPASVPDVVGQTEASVTAAITAAGLKVGTITEAFSDTVPAGQVISQHPAPTAQVSPGTFINLVVSKGPEIITSVTVPNVVGLMYETAWDMIQAAGLYSYGYYEVYSETAPVSQVLSQEPAAGTQVDPGSFVQATISKGPRPDNMAVVPDVVGMPQAEAEAAVIAARLTVRSVSETFSLTVPVGDVISQNPQAGFETGPGIGVDLLVSKGMLGGTVVNVPDANLAACLCALCGLPVGTPLTDAYLATLWSLPTDKLGIADLTGLEYAVNLRSIHLSGEPVTDYSPLAGLANLEELWIFHPPLTDLSSLAGMTYLKSLAILGSKVEDLSPLAGLTNLAQLGLCSTLVKDLSPLAGLTELELLWVQGSQVTDLTPLAGLTSLTELRLDSSQVTDVAPLAGLTKLTTLSLSSNQVATVGSLVSGTIFTDVLYPASLNLKNNPLLPNTIAVEIPALEARGVTVVHD